MALGATRRGIELPSVDRVGWYAGGARPGEPGRTVLIGHRDSAEGAAIFARLGEAALGSRIEVTAADGRRHRYRVARKISVPKNFFPAASVYGRTARSALVLITCGGEFDESTGHYANNVLVFARSARAGAAGRKAARARPAGKATRAKRASPG